MKQKQPFPAFCYKLNKQKQTNKKKIPLSYSYFLTESIIAVPWLLIEFLIQMSLPAHTLNSSLQHFVPTDDW